MSEKQSRKVVFCIPTLTRPYQQTLDALAASVPAIEQAGWLHELVYEIGCPYVSAARATMLRKALDAKATVIVFIDHDVSWDPRDLLALIETEGDVVAGTYRFKKDGPDEYMGALADSEYPIVRADGCVKMAWTPAGFLKVTRAAVNRIIEAYPELCYGERCAPSVDLFQHGADKNVWWGEDAAFGRRWNDCGGELWLIPMLNITHHSSDGTAYPGNYHEYLLRQAGGSESSNPIPPSERVRKIA